MVKEKISKVITFVFFILIIFMNTCMVYGVDLEEFREKEYESVNEFGSLTPISSISDIIFGNMINIILLVVVVAVIITVIVKRKNNQSYNEPKKKVQKSQSVNIKKEQDDDIAMDKIKKLKNLLDEGAITQEEFDKKKKDLLNKI